MQGIKRRVVYVGLYELVAIILSAILLEWMTSEEAQGQHAAPDDQTQPTVGF